MGALLDLYKTRKSTVLDEHLITDGTRGGSSKFFSTRRITCNEDLNAKVTRDDCFCPWSI